MSNNIRHIDWGAGADHSNDKDGDTLDNVTGDFVRANDSRPEIASEMPCVVVRDGSITVKEFEGVLILFDGISLIWGNNSRSYINRRRKELHQVIHESRYPTQNTRVLN
jgi:hypothetical protein